MSQIKSLLGDSLVYGLGSFLLKATQVLILPLILFYLKKEEFGTLDYFLNIKNILIIVYGWGVLTSIFKFADFSEHKKDRSPFMGFLVSLTIIGVSSLIIFIASLFWDIPKEFYENILYIQIISAFGALMTIPLGILRQKRMPLNYILVNTIFTGTFLATSYFLMLHSSLNYRSVLIGHSLAAFFSFLYGTYKVRKDIEFSFCMTLFKKMFTFGFSILLNSISFVVILATTRFFLKANGSFEDVGILGMALRLSLFVGALLVSPFTLAWLPFVKSQLNKNNFHQTMNNTFRIYLWLGLLFCLALELLLPDLFYLIKNNEYATAINYVLPFSLSYYIQGIYFIFAAGIFITGNTKHYRLIGFAGILINLLLYIIFLRNIDIQSVALITLASFLTIMSLSYYYGNKTLKIKAFNFYNTTIFVSYSFLLLIAIYLRTSYEFTYFSLTMKIATIFSLLGAHILLERKLLNQHE